MPAHRFQSVSGIPHLLLELTSSINVGYPRGGVFYPAPTSGLSLRQQSSLSNVYRSTMVIFRSSTIPFCHETRRIFISTVEIASNLFFLLLVEVFLGRFVSVKVAWSTPPHFQARMTRTRMTRRPAISILNIRLFSLGIWEQ